MASTYSDNTMQSSQDQKLIRWRRRLFAASIGHSLICLSLYAGYAVANPEGGRVVAGDITISSGDQRLDVIQRTDKGIVDWRGFSIAPGEHTNFSQPSQASVTLNRVTGADLSHIEGRLTANGRVFLVNPNGVIFGPDSKVSVGALVATVSDIPNDKFLDGNYRFERASSDPDAAVVNRGEIQVSEGGAVVLVAPRVSNEGSIRARLGRVELAGAETFTVDFDGDGLLSFQLGEPVKQTPEATVAKTGALVANKGEILADGGVVTLSASAADAVVDRVINMEGVIQAQAVEQRGGVIVLSGGDQGIVSVSGTLDVSAAGAGQTGGTVKVLGEKIGLMANAEIDANGHDGGGGVLIGGSLQGKGPEPNAMRTFVDVEARITADAAVEGDGGRVIVWSDQATRYRGDISARGGEQGGDGGFVEISGKQQLEFQGSVDVGAVQGRDGTVLLDPDNIYVRTTGTNDSLVIADNAILTSEYLDQTLEFSKRALETIEGNIVLQAGNNITLYPGSALDLQNQTAGESVVLSAGEIDFQDEIKTHGADVILEADTLKLSHYELDDIIGAVVSPTDGRIDADTGNIVITADNLTLAPQTRIIGSGDLTIQPRSPDRNIDLAINIHDGLELDQNLFDTIVSDGFNSVTIGRENGSHHIEVGQITFNHPMILRAPAGGDINFAGAVDIHAHPLTLDTGGIGNVTAVNPDNDFHSISINANKVDLVDVNDVQLLSSSIADDLAVIAGGAITGSDAITVGGVSDFTATDAIAFINPFSDFSTVRLNANAANLVDADNIELLTTTLDGSLTIAAGGSITGSDAITVGGDVDLLAEGRIDLAGPITMNGAGGFTAAGAIRLDNPNNDFIGLIGITNSGIGDVTIDAIDAVNFTFLHVGSGKLTINAQSGITAGSFTQERAAGIATFRTVEGPIDLGGISNDFSGQIALFTQGTEDVTLFNNDAVLLGSSDLGTGTFTVTGQGISQTGALTVTGTTFLDAGTGPISLMEPENRFAGGIGLSSTGSSDIQIVTADSMTLMNSVLGSGDAILRARDLNLVGTVQGTGSLVLKPYGLDQDIGLGEGVGSFSLSNTDLAQLVDGFASIQIGASGMTGQVTIENAVFSDPLVVQADGVGAGILINDSLIGRDNAGITFNGSGGTTTLNGDIITEGNYIAFNDTVRLARDALLDTTNGDSTPGGDITVNGPMVGSYRLTVRGGFFSNQANAPLDLGGLYVIPTGNPGNGADVYGTVDGLEGRFAAQAVKVGGEVFDPNFQINGCMMGISCEGLLNTTFIDPPRNFNKFRNVDARILPQDKMIAVWFQRVRLEDPRDSRYSNLGNEELWVEKSNQ